MTIAKQTKAQLIEHIAALDAQLLQCGRQAQLLREQWSAA